MAEVKFTLQSLDDLDDIAEFISRDSAYYASMQVEKLIQRTDILENFPLIGRVVPELKIKSVREIIEGNYRIVYRVLGKGLVHILTFHHSRKKLKPTILRKIIKRLNR
jgi:addiction module RelE/StbE family toxin